MHIVKMLVTFVVIIVGDHLVGVAFEAHTFVATTASDTIATIDTNKRHFTSLVRTCSYISKPQLSSFINTQLFIILT